ncbi:MAG: GGDEF domain-containing protein [Gammaproteobacteria bacterium]|nr:GGDEF domain-containing protein [Gammaproteobacteria bacterium]
MAIYTYPNNREQQITAPATTAEQLGVAPAELQHTLRVAGLLQTSLELDTILNLFLGASEEKVEFDGAHFDFAPLSYEYKFGKKKRHTCSYRLKLAGEFLGELEFSRAKRFAQQELELLENILCQLIYPLRNAIWYQHAIMASQTDPLTGIQNRAAMDTMLQREVELAHRNNTPLSLIVADIDHFKKVNDQFGHSVGDDVLKAFAQCISNNLRGSDVVFRYGGEEFVILLTGSDGRSARAVANRVRKAIENCEYCIDVPMTASLGTASLTNKDSTESLFKKADQALYCAKESGRNQVVSFQSLIKTS